MILSCLCYLGKHSSNSHAANAWGKAKGTGPKLDRWLGVTICIQGVPGRSVRLTGGTDTAHAFSSGHPAELRPPCPQHSTGRAGPGARARNTFHMAGLSGRTPELPVQRSQPQRHLCRGQRLVRLLKERALQPSEIKLDTWDQCQNVCGAASPCACMLCRPWGEQESLTLHVRIPPGRRLGETSPLLGTEREPGAGLGWAVGISSTQPLVYTLPTALYLHSIFNSFNPDTWNPAHFLQVWHQHLWLFSLP